MTAEDIDYRQFDTAGRLLCFLAFGLQFFSTVRYVVDGMVHVITFVVENVLKALCLIVVMATKLVVFMVEKPFNTVCRLFGKETDREIKVHHIRQFEW